MVWGLSRTSTVLLDYALTKGIKTPMVWGLSRTSTVLLDYALTKGIKTNVVTRLRIAAASYWTTP